MLNKPILLRLLAVLISACSSTPIVNYYVLEAGAYDVQAAAPINPQSQLLIGVGPVTLPSLLDRKKIVTRQKNNHVQIAEFQQWAMPLQDNVSDVLRQNLAYLQPSHLFRAYPWNAHGTVDLQIVIDVLRLDTTAGETGNLEADWTIKEEKTQRILKTGKTTLSAALPDASYAAVAHSLSLLLSRFSLELSAVLTKLDNT